MTNIKHYFCSSLFSGLLNTHRHDGLLASSDSDDGGMPPAKPERKPKKRIPSSVPQPPTMEDHDDMEGPSADGIRQQLMGLESMYKEILTVSTRLILVDSFSYIGTSILKTSSADFTREQM